MVKREPGDMAGVILQLLTRPCSRRRDRIGASNMAEHILVKLGGVDLSPRWRDASIAGRLGGL